MAISDRKNQNLMNFIRKVHGVVENVDLEKHRQSQAERSRAVIAGTASKSFFMIQLLLRLVLFAQKPVDFNFHILNKSAFRIRAYRNSEFSEVFEVSEHIYAHFMFTLP